MDVLTDAFVWLNDPLNWTGRNGVLALDRASTSSMSVARRRCSPPSSRCRSGSGSGTAAAAATVGVVVANTSRALPTLALLTLLAASGLFGNTRDGARVRRLRRPADPHQHGARASARSTPTSGTPPAAWACRARAVAVGGRAPARASRSSPPGCAPRPSRCSRPCRSPRWSAGAASARSSSRASAPSATGRCSRAAILVAGLCLVAEGLLAVAQHAADSPGPARAGPGHVRHAVPAHPPGARHIPSACRARDQRIEWSGSSS